MTEYEASEQPTTYAPAQDTGTDASAPHFEVEGASDPAANGPLTFRYPSAFQEARIGVRMAELAKSDVGVTIGELPMLARMYIRAIATLEFVIVTAPGREEGGGWYMRNDAGRPVLAPGQLTNGDEHKVLEAYEAFVRWKDRFRGSPAGPRNAEEPAAVVSSGEADGRPA